MKKKIIGGIAILAIAAVAAFNVNVNLNLAQESNMSPLALANIEALAQSEGGGGMTLNCWNTVTNDRTLDNPVLSTHVTYCGSCSAVLATSYSSASTCKSK